MGWLPVLVRRLAFGYLVHQHFFSVVSLGFAFFFAPLSPSFVRVSCFCLCAFPLLVRFVRYWHRCRYGLTTLFFGSNTPATFASPIRVVQGEDGHKAIGHATS